MRYRLWCARMEIKYIRILWLWRCSRYISTHGPYNYRKMPSLDHKSSSPASTSCETHILSIYEGNLRVNDMFLMNGNHLPVHEAWGSSYNAGLHRTTNVSMLCQQIKMHFKAIHIVLTSVVPFFVICGRYLRNSSSSCYC